MKNTQEVYTCIGNTVIKSGDGNTVNRSERITNPGYAKNCIIITSLDKSDIEEGITQFVFMDEDSRFNFHIFVDRFMDSFNLRDTIKKFLNTIKNRTPLSKLIVHVYKNADYLQHTLSTLDYLKSYKQFRLITESKDPIFILDNVYNMELRIHYEKDKVIPILSSDLVPVPSDSKRKKFSNTDPDVCEERFKDVILDRFFMSNFPLAILSVFTDENDIYDYIANRERWVGMDIGIIKEDKDENI